MDSTNFLITIATSTFVSGTVSFLLKTYFQNKIELRYKKELESFKEQLSINSDVDRYFAQKKLEARSKFGEVIYNTRDTCRRIKSNYEFSSNYYSTLSKQIDILISYIGTYQIDWKNEPVFKSIHSYKNNLNTFYALLTKFYFYFNDQKKDESAKIKNQLEIEYNEIEKKYNLIIDSLST